MILSYRPSSEFGAMIGKGWWGPQIHLEAITFSSQLVDSFPHCLFYVKFRFYADNLIPVVEHNCDVPCEFEVPQYWSIESIDQLSGNDGYINYFHTNGLELPFKVLRDAD